MSIVIIAPTRDSDQWLQPLRSANHHLLVEDYEEVQYKASVTCAVVWLHPYGVLQEFPNLRLICSMGAGVDHILNDPYLPDVPITRVVSDRLAQSMNTYVAMGVLNYHRNFYKYQQDQRDRIWDQDTFPELETRVGIFGFGYLGQEIGKTLKALGFDVCGYSQSGKSMHDIPCYAADELDEFLKQVNVLVGVLPMTKATEGIFSKSLFLKFAEPVYLINIGRGKQQVEKDIVEALDTGVLSGALLDVFESEPLKKDSPLWDHPKVVLTPHIAGITNPEAAVPQIVTNYQAMKEGKPLIHQVDISKGY
ncbi:MAG: glyoxylate/hydroxypyruvate reductase A [Bacteroidota bacterium]